MGGIRALQKFRNIKIALFWYVMATMEAILKFFKQHLLPNCKLDWAETWWEASVAILKPHLLPNPKSDWAQTW